MTDIERINALTTNARNTWFVLLAALVFVGITLMSIEHIDFYGVDRATTLPLVNVEVPTRAFFVAAPLLIAAIYSYFHLYLVRLWDALSTAPARIDKRPLGDVISPWLVTDAALHMRARRRKEYRSPTTHRVLESTAMWLNFAIAWAFGLIVIGLLWWLSMPARSFGLTLSAALSLFAMSFTGLTSFLMLRRRMTSGDIQNSGHIFSVAPGLLALVFLCFPLVLVSYVRTEGEFTRLTDVFPTLESQKDRLARLDTRLTALDPTGRILTLAPLNLAEEQLVQRPQGWLTYAEAQKDYFASWCKREGAPCRRADLDQTQERTFADEWNIRRSAARGDLQKPNWNSVDVEKPDLRNAIMPSTFLSGSHLRGAQMEGAFLIEAQMEGAILRDAQMEEADLRGAWMEGADLRGAQMERADLFRTQMEGAILRDAQMKGADLKEAQMEGANFSKAQMEEADLRGAQMEGASLSGAQMEGANLSWAQMEEVNLRGAQMEGADLSYSHLTGKEDRKSLLQSTNFSASRNNGGALRFLDMTEIVFDGRTDFRNAFMDGSVELTDAFRMQLGDQCQSRLDTVLSDEEFYGRWLGWLLAEPDSLSTQLVRWYLPAKWKDVEPIAPDPGCVWKPPLVEVQGVTDVPDVGQN
jgi:uncharacterized protein YjbI with pentapeptide repeats